PRCVLDQLLPRPPDRPGRPLDQHPGRRHPGHLRRQARMTTMDERSRSEYFLERLVGVASVSGQEEACLEVCDALMREVGLATRRRPCPGVEGAYNVEGVAGAGRPKLVLTAHIDTVPIEGMTVNHLGERRGNRYYGRGATDMKGGLAAMLSALDRLHRAGTRLAGEVVLVATVFE